MSSYRKKPVVIEARQYPGHSIEGVDNLIAFEEWLEPIAKAAGRWPLKYVGQSLIIPTLEGDHEAKPGDYIIRGVKGEIYPCKPEIFAATYDVADSAQSANTHAIVARVEELAMIAFSDALPVRDECNGEQTILTYNENVGVYDLHFFETMDEFPDCWLGCSHWMDITGMWPGVTAQVTEFRAPQPFGDDAVERVARAMHNARYPKASSDHPDLWEQLAERSREMWRASARGGLAAFNAEGESATK